MNTNSLNNRPNITDQLGHTNPRATRINNYFRGFCDCGYQTLKRHVDSTKAEHLTIEALLYHISSIANQAHKQARANGITIDQVIQRELNNPPKFPSEPEPEGYAQPQDHLTTRERLKLAAKESDTVAAETLPLDQLTKKQTKIRHRLDSEKLLKPKRPKPEPIKPDRRPYIQPTKSKRPKPLTAAQIQAEIDALVTDDTFR